MSTRATYRFSPNTKNESERFGPGPITLYIHWDGYPEGAAAYFYAACEHPNRRGTMAEAMIRANDGAEITRSHEAHGDTEYRYDVCGLGPGATITARKLDGWDDPKWTAFFTGTLAEFIAKYGEMIENRSDFRLVKLGDYRGDEWLNTTTARHRIFGNDNPEVFDSSILGHLRVWSKHSGTNRDSANWRGMVESLRVMVEAFPELLTDEIRGYLGSASATA